MIRAAGTRRWRGEAALCPLFSAARSENDRRASGDTGRAMTGTRLASGPCSCALLHVRVLNNSSEKFLKAAGIEVAKARRVVRNRRVPRVQPLSPRAVGVPLSGCGPSFSVQSRTAGSAGAWGALYVVPGRGLFEPPGSLTELAGATCVYPWGTVTLGVFVVVAG